MGNWLALFDGQTRYTLNIRFTFPQESGRSTSGAEHVFIFISKERTDAYFSPNPVSLEG